MRALRHRVLALVALGTATAPFVPVAPAAAQQPPFDFYARGPYRPEVPRPDSLLGYGAGARQTQYAAQQAVLDRLVAASGGRATRETIGTTEEGRVMRVVLISSPANIARLDAIRADLARLADPAHTSAEQASAIAARTPVVVFLSYSIHGNEPGGFEAAMWVAYQLIASEEPATRMVRDSVLVILNPSANPDGHERFATWYDAIVAGDGADDPASYEWNEPWSIMGRVNHYRFDMNRDLIAVSQAPTRAMLAAIGRWHPQVFVDLHSTTEQYFFPPFAEPVNTNIPATSLRWIEVFGRGNAKAFDHYGWQYFTRDRFDGFYVGYFDAAPTALGATGMTYETDGGKAFKRKRDDGTIITLRDGIAHHFVASLATAETAAQNRTPRLADYAEFYRNAVADARAARMKRIVVLPDDDPTNAARLATILLRYGIAVRRLTAPYTAAAAHAYLGPPAAERRTFPAGALVVDLAQPQGRMARALLEPDPDEPPAFRQRELEKYVRNVRRGEGETERYDFYDVTAWSLPYTMGLDAWWTEDLAPTAGDDLTLPEGDPVQALAPAGGVSARAGSAYVFRNDRQAAARLALALLKAGFVLNAATEPLRADGVTYPRGTFVARVTRNPASLHERIAALATETGVLVTAVQSAFPDSGPIGVGSEEVRPVFRPRVLVATGDGVSLTSYGATWYFLERELDYPFVPVALATLGRMQNLSDYNVLLIPGGSAGGIRQQIGSGGIDRLKAWVRDGGAVIAWGGAALFLSSEGVELSTVTRKGAPEKGKEQQKKGDSLPADTALTPPLASPSADTTAVESIPGAIFRAALDPTQWLTFGYERKELAVPLSGGTFLTPSKAGANAVAFVADSSRLAGFVWPNTQRLLKGTVWAAVESQGRGSAVVFADDPLFRAFWRGTARLVTNAMLFGTGR
jgi:hypothetical protein